jgi:molecular chaperone GrpE
LKSDLFKKILPRIDDLERIIKNTPENEQNWVLFEWLFSLYKKLIKDLDSLWVKSFNSIWNKIDPDKHDVMTTLIWKEEWIIVDEFEKGYMLGGRILRHAKVIVWAWEE